MSRRMRSRCEGHREADVEKAFTRAHGEWKCTRRQRVPCELGGGLFHELRSSQVRGTDSRPACKLSGLISLLISISFYTRFQVMRSRCQDECEADVKISSLEFVQSVQDNAKPMSCRKQSRCQDNAKPMSKRMRNRHQ